MQKYIQQALAIAAIILSAQTISSQTLEKMNWFNEPASWHIDGNRLSMHVTAHTDYWRISHYGFTVDDAPFYYAEYGGEFQATLKIEGNYIARFDQAGMMIRLNHENYIKTGIEFVDGKYNLSTIVTHRTSDWSVRQLDKPIEAIWIKAIRRLDAVEIFYSTDGREYHMMRNAPLQANHPVKIGMYAASPDGNGFNVTFSDFTVTHLPDHTRTQWLKNNPQQ